MTITEFLEARIAEDESLAVGQGYRSYHDVECGVGLGYWANDECACDGPARVLAECAAKRKIVQYATGLRLDRARDAETDAQYRSVWWVLWQFATAYQSHPEYREDWEL